MSDAQSTAHNRKRGRPPIEAEIRLGDWAARGMVEAVHDGSRVLVDRAIPKEMVSVTIRRGREPRKGMVKGVIEASVDRVDPPCEAYDRGCGGCQWQHLAYSAQTAAKHILVDRDLAAAGVRARVEAVHEMQIPWRYRRTAAIALGWEAGFRPRGRRGIVEINDCPISHPLIGELASKLNRTLRAGSLPNYHGKVWLDCAVVGLDDNPALQIVIQGIAGLTLESNPELRDIASTLMAIDHVGSVAYRHRDGRVEPLIGSLFAIVEIVNRPFYLPAGSFLQANLDMMPVLVRHLKDSLRQTNARRSADIYGGIGVFGLLLAESLEHVTLVELDPRAVEAAQMTASAWKVDNMGFVARHAERALADLERIDLAIVDPPRSGLGREVTDTMAKLQIPSIFYVSCSPSSLARDLADLETKGYNVSNIELFDFYPQTYHIEALAILTR